MSNGVDSGRPNDRSPASVTTIGRSMLTGALAALVFFVACWAGAALGLPGSRHFVALFTTAPTASGAALLTGSVSGLVAGALAGGLIAGFWRLTAPR